MTCKNLCNNICISIASRQNPFSLIVALDESGQASGNLFADDGESLNGEIHGLLLNFTADQV